MTKEEYLFKLSLLQQEANKLEEQIQLINQQVSELEILKMSLEKIDKIEEKEILASLGKGIFIKAEKKENELFVNIGEGVVVKKTSKETCDIIDKQIKQLEEIKINLLSEIEKINFQLQELVKEAREESR